MTRRELRLADERAHRRRRRGFPRLFPLRAAMAVAVVLAVSGALLGGGTPQVYTDRVERAQHERAAAEVAHQNANRVRSERAERARFHDRAVAYAVIKRGEAVVAARAAVANAVTVVASSAADVTPETLTPLGDAMTSLVASIEAAPIAPVAPAAPVAPVSPIAPVVAVAVTIVVPAEPVVAAPAAEPAPEVAAAGQPTDDVAAESEPADPMEAVDLDVSAQMLAAAQVVTDLSVQVQETAAANVAAEAAAQAAAAAAAEAAAAAAKAAAASARTAAAELARKVTAVVDSPNGDVSADVLCGLSFAPESLVRCDAAQALEKLGAAYRADFGRDLVVVSSYRSFATQVEVKASRGYLAAAPGYSNHGRGIAVDFAGFGSVGQFNIPAYLWMKTNAAEFGWGHPVYMEPGRSGPQEPWHWEFGTDDPLSPGRPTAAAPRPA